MIVTFYTEETPDKFFNNNFYITYGIAIDMKIFFAGYFEHLIGENCDFNVINVLALALWHEMILNALS